MKLPVSYLILFVSLLLIAACKKSNDTKKSPAAQMLENGKWQMVAYTAKLNYLGMDTVIDEYVDMNDCDKDDFLTFAADGKAYMDESVNKCSYDNQIESAQWTLLNNDTKIAIADDNPDTMDFEINAAQMKWKLYYVNSSGTTVTNEYTFKNIK